MSADQRRQRRWARAAELLLLLCLAAAVLVPVSYVTTAPGPTFDVLGEQDGEPVVAVSGAATYPTPGVLDMVTVAQDGATSSLHTGAAIAAWLLPTRSVVLRDVRFPQGVEPEREREVSHALYEASTSSALAAAAQQLGRPVTTQALVSGVAPGAPADGVLRPGDVVTSVAGNPVATAAEVAAQVAARPGGSDVDLTYVRDGAPASVTITSGTRPDGSAGAYLGIVLIDSYSSDFTAAVSLQGVGGPSAGMVFALAMVDLMTPGALVDGAHIAGTGTIDAAGNVGPIGGIDKKIVSVERAGAGLFLVPEANCEELAGSIPEGLAVVPVTTLATAIDSISAWRTGDRGLPTCFKGEGQ